MNRGLLRTLLIVSAALQVPALIYTLASFGSAPIPPMAGTLAFMMLMIVAAGLRDSWRVLVLVGVAIDVVSRFFFYSTGWEAPTLFNPEIAKETLGVSTEYSFFSWNYGQDGFALKVATAGVVIAIVALVLGQLMGVKAPVSKDRVSGALPVANPDGTVPEGWYADPDGRMVERFWDGTDWTDKSRPMTTTSVALRQAASSNVGRPAFDEAGNPISTKSRSGALALCFFLGIFGAHRFYVGKVGTGIAQFFTLGGLGIWVLVDLIMILAGSFRDKKGDRVATW